MPTIRVIRVFLASSVALQEERTRIGHWISSQNDSLTPQGIYLYLVSSDKLSSSFSPAPKQEEFNDEVTTSDIFICLVHDRLGQFTNQEFQKAYQSLRAGKLPRLLLVYFKNTEIKPSTLGPEFERVLELKNQIREEGQMWREYSSSDELLLHLTNEFDTYLRTQRSLRVQGAYSNLPNMPHFVGRQEQLTQIADALTSEARGWGIMIDGPGGIGKTSLAIVAAHRAPDDDFPIKIFLSAKTTELTAEGRVLAREYALADFEALMSELAAELDAEEIRHMPAGGRAKEVRRCLSNKKALLVLDNVEEFPQEEADRLFYFLKFLPYSCKAIVTSRRRTGDIFTGVIRLGRLKLEEALKLIDELAQENNILARSAGSEREYLYEITAGNPLLIKWVCGQLMRDGSRFQTIDEACEFMKSTPKDNPLEFIFENLILSFSATEITVLSALTHFSEPAKLEWVAELACLPHDTADAALERLADRALLDADGIRERFFLPTLTAAFLRRVCPEAVEQTGDRLLKNVSAFVDENGAKQYERFPKLEAEWPSISAALQLIQKSDNIKLQYFYNGINTFLDFSGRHDELLSLCQIAEEKAHRVQAFNTAAAHAYQAGCIFAERKQAEGVSNAALRCEEYWRLHTEQVNLSRLKDKLIQMGKHEQAMILRLRGLFHQLEGNYSAAREELLKAQELYQSVAQPSKELVIVMNDLGVLHDLMEDKFASGRYLTTALERAREANFKEEILTCLRNLSLIKYAAGELPAAKSLAREGIYRAAELHCDRLIEEFGSLLATTP